MWSLNVAYDREETRGFVKRRLTALAMVFDHAGVSPNPARDRVIVKLPRDEAEEPSPPTAVATLPSVLDPSSPYSAASGNSPAPTASRTITHARGTSCPPSERT